MENQDAKIRILYQISKRSVKRAESYSDALTDSMEF